jgi:hypothetical protein
MKAFRLVSHLNLNIYLPNEDGFSRREIQLAEFLPYAKAFLQNGGSAIYLAMDAQNVVQKVQEKWDDIQQHLKTQRDSVRKNHRDIPVASFTSRKRWN